MTESLSESSAQFADALRRLARGSPMDLSALLHEIESSATVDGTKVVTHCHCVKLDGNGRPRLEDLVRAIAEHALDYAIPRSEIGAALAEVRETGSTQKIVRLQNDAVSLFTDIENSGEGGELLLFTLAEKVLGLPQVLCKMSLKTNSRMHVHGADGVHAAVDVDTGKLALYWGESKIYGDAGAAIRECVSSIARMFNDPDASSRDLQLLQRHADLEDSGLEDALKRFLDPDSELSNLLEFRGLCLVGFDCDAYPTSAAVTALAAVVEAISGLLPGWKSTVSGRILAERIESFSIHFLLVPFPSADGFRQLLRSYLGLTSGKRTRPTGSEESAAGPTPSGAAEKVSASAPRRPTSKRKPTGPSARGKGKKGRGSP